MQASSSYYEKFLIEWVYINSSTGSIHMPVKEIDLVVSSSKWGSGWQPKAAREAEVQLEIL